MIEFVSCQSKIPIILALVFLALQATAKVTHTTGLYEDDEEGGCTRTEEIYENVSLGACCGSVDQL